MTDDLSELVMRRHAEKAARDYAEGRGKGTDQLAFKRIGAAYIGTECSRALAYAFHKVPKTKPRDQKLQLHADIGHAVERIIRQAMEDAGFVFRPEPDGEQHGWMAAKGPNGKHQMAGEVDGIIEQAPIDWLPVPLILECKKMKASKYRRYLAKGLAVEDPRYFGQCQINMAYLHMPLLLAVMNVNTAELHFERVPFVAHDAQYLSDRAVRTIETTDPLEMPRISSDPSDFRCKFCDWKDACWT